MSKLGIEEVCYSNSIWNQVQSSKAAVAIVIVAIAAVARSIGSNIYVGHKSELSSLHFPTTVLYRSIALSSPLTGGSLETNHCNKIVYSLHRVV